MSKRPNQTDKLESGDQLVIFKSNCSDYRVMPFDALVQQILSGIPTPEYVRPITQHFNPNANFSLDVENHAEGTYLFLAPSTGIDTGEIVLPNNYEVVDAQEVTVSCTQQINNFSVDGNGASVIGEPNAIASTGFFKLKYDKLSGTWYRVG